MGKRGRREEERGRGEGSYFTRGRVTCLFRVVEQIYIALSPPVIPLSRCCCRTLDSARRREIKGTAGRGEGEWEGEGEGTRGKGKRGGKKKENGRKKNEKYIVSWNIGARGAAKCPATLCMHCPRTPRFYFSALLYLQKIIRVASPRPRAAHRLFSVPRCVRAAAAELNRLVHDRANLRTVVSREKKIRERKNKRDAAH